MLCSGEKTYGMRSIGLSNTFLVVTPVPDDCASQFADDTVVIRDQLKEIIELTPSVPKLHKLSRLLKDRQYDEGLEEDDDEDDSVVGFPAKQKKTQSVHYWNNLFRNATLMKTQERMYRRAMQNLYMP
jgi:sister chromatid cohesion protein DCC1